MPAESNSSGGNGVRRTLEVAPADRPVVGTWQPPGDKSISHRAAILASMATGQSVIEGYSDAGDCAATVGVLSSLSVRIEALPDEGTLQVRGGRYEEPTEPLDCRRSGTTMRLMTGALAAAPFPSTLAGDEQLLRRPMERVARPLRIMGARVDLAPGGRPPVSLHGANLTGIPYRLPLPSAQVKSAVLLAGLSAAGATTVIEPVPTRDHTERLLAWLGMPIDRLVMEDGGRAATVTASAPPSFRLSVPGDLSSAAFLVAAAALIPGSDLIVRNVGLNPTRMGFISALVRMGGSVEAEPESADPEPFGRLRIRHASLHGISLGPDDIPAIVDELPLVGLLATQAEGVTEVRGASELRVKESDRIAGLVTGLQALGADAEELPDGFVVRGPVRLSQAGCDPQQDHRLAMTFAVAGLVASGPVRILDMGAAADSFPSFARALGSLR